LERALDESKTLVAIAGAPVEMSKDVSPTPTDKRGIIEFPVFLAPSFKYRKKENGHDFFDVPVDRELGVRIPNFFHGVSGGAVWRLVNLFERDPPMHELKSSDYVLAGIAFWQGFENFRPKFIRGHGPRSLYEKFLPALRKWLKQPGQVQDLP